jgi:hypothetical protein
MDNSKTLDRIARNINSNSQLQCWVCVQDEKVIGSLIAGLKAYKLVLRIDKSGGLAAAIEITMGQLQPSQRLYLSRLAGQAVIAPARGRWYLILRDSGGDEIRLTRSLRALLGSVSEALRLLTTPELAQAYMSLGKQEGGDK